MATQPGGTPRGVNPSTSATPMPMTASTTATTRAIARTGRGYSSGRERVIRAAWDNRDCAGSPVGRVGTGGVDGAGMYKFTGQRSEHDHKLDNDDHDHDDRGFRDRQRSADE